MRVVFAGTPDFARHALQALLVAGYDIALVLTQPDRPAGRGLRLTPSPVKEAALAAGIEVLQPRSLRLDGPYAEQAHAAQMRLAALVPDVMVVAAYGLILPHWTLTLPKHGCLNIHASLLPRWRGAAPIQRAIEAGDSTTGVSIMQMDEGLDTGAVLLEREVPIEAHTTAADLHDALAVEGARAIVTALAGVQAGELVARKQADRGVTYAAKLDKAEAALDLRRGAQELERRIRAFNPVPGATLCLPGLSEPVKVWRAQVLNYAIAVEPGTVLSVSSQGIDIATGEGVLRVLELQKAGGKRQSVEVFVRGWHA